MTDVGSPDRPAGLSERKDDHAGHEIVTKAPDMGGRSVVICVTCNARLSEWGSDERREDQHKMPQTI